MFPLGRGQCSKQLLSVPLLCTTPPLRCILFSTFTERVNVIACLQWRLVECCLFCLWHNASVAVCRRYLYSPVRVRNINKKFLLNKYIVIRVPKPNNNENAITITRTNVKKIVITSNNNNNCLGFSKKVYNIFHATNHVNC